MGSKDATDKKYENHIKDATDKKYENGIKDATETTKIAASSEDAAEGLENVPIKAEDERPDTKSTPAISEDTTVVKVKVSSVMSPAVEAKAEEFPAFSHTVASKPAVI